MDLRDTIRSTGAVREFRDGPVDDAVVVAILDDARFAPSGGNRQPWKVAIVTDRDRRQAIADQTQPVWDEYVTASREGQVPFNSVDYRTPADIAPAHNPLLANIQSVPVVLAVAADLRKIVAMDASLDRTAIVPGASIYPFCWNILLAARGHGLGGVMTTFASVVEPGLTEVLALPDHHALAAVLFVGYPVNQPTQLRRSEVSSFATLDTFDGPAFD